MNHLAETWSRDRQVLLAVARLLEENPGHAVRITDVCTSTGLPAAQATASLRALAESFVTLRRLPAWVPLAPPLWATSLTAHGRQVVGQWPADLFNEHSNAQEVDAVLSGPERKLGSMNTPKSWWGPCFAKLSKWWQGNNLNRVDYGTAVTWRPTGSHLARGALIAGALAYMYSYLAARSFYRGFGVPLQEFDLSYPVLVARSAAFAGLVLFYIAIAPLGGIPYNRWLLAYVHKKIPTGVIPGQPILGYVVSFQFGLLILLPMGLFVGVFLSIFVIWSIPTAPADTQAALAWGVLTLVTLTAGITTVVCLARANARGALRDCLQRNQDPISPQTRIMQVTLGLALLSGAVAYGAINQGSGAANALIKGSQVPATSRWADEQSIPSAICVHAKWVNPPKVLADIGDPVIYLGGHNDQVILYDRTKHRAIWLYAGDVALVHASCRATN